MSSDSRREMFRKCDRAVGNLEQSQEHLVWIIDLFRLDKSIEQLIEMQANKELIKENHRYALQLDATLQAITFIETVKEGVVQLKEFLRQL